jgi:hypothetical protein
MALQAEAEFDILARREERFLTPFTLLAAVK